MQSQLSPNPASASSKPIDLDQARAERAAADPAAFAAERPLPLSVAFSDPEAFAAAQPEVAAKICAMGQKLARRLVLEAPLERIADDDGAHDILRRVRAERQRRGEESAMQLFGALAPRRRVVHVAQGRRAPRAAAVRTRGSRRTSSSSSTSGSDPGDSDPGDPAPTAGEIFEEQDRFCLCGCGRSLTEKATQARFYEPEACRKRFSRSEAKRIAERPVFAEPAPVGEQPLVAGADRAGHLHRPQVDPPDVDPEVLACWAESTRLDAARPVLRHPWRVGTGRVAPVVHRQALIAGLS